MATNIKTENETGGFLTATLEATEVSCGPVAIVKVNPKASYLVIARFDAKLTMEEIEQLQRLSMEKVEVIMVDDFLSLDFYELSPVEQDA